LGFAAFCDGAVLDKCIDIIHKKGIKELFDRWFVIRVRQYIEAFPDKRLALHTADDLTAET